MSARVMWVSEGRWRSLPEGLRRRVLDFMPRSLCVGNWGGNVENALRARGEHELAREFLAELEGTACR